MKLWSDVSVCVCVLLGPVKMINYTNMQITSTQAAACLLWVNMLIMRLWKMGEWGGKRERGGRAV